MTIQDIFDLPDDAKVECSECLVAVPWQNVVLITLDKHEPPLAYCPKCRPRKSPKETP